MLKGKIDLAPKLGESSVTSKYSSVRRTLKTTNLIQMKSLTAKAFTIQVRLSSKLDTS